MTNSCDTATGNTIHSEAEWQKNIVSTFNDDNKEADRKRQEAILQR